MAGIKKKILFVCIENSCRSQMAEGFVRHLGRGIVEACSAGSKPSRAVEPDAIRAMQEIGIDISAQKPKGFEDFKDVDFDYVVTMGCADVCPFMPADKHLDWQIADPKGKGMVFFRKTREEIKEKIGALIKDLTSGNNPP